MKSNLKIAANIVTMNRPELFLQCLQSLIDQTTTLSAITVIDNSDNFDTYSLLIEKNYLSKETKDPQRRSFSLTNTIDNGTELFYVKPEKNTGSGGGRHLALKHDFEQGYDFFWIVDDDTKTRDTALEKLIEKLPILEKESIGFLGSKCIGKDGSILNMNLPLLSATLHGKPFNLYEKKNTLIVSECSFVSFMISRETIKQVGYPLKSFQIWGDDLEYSNRITCSGMLGFYVSDSLVEHHMSGSSDINLYSDKIENIWKYPHGVRNNLYVIRRGNALKYIYYFFRSLVIVNIKIILKRSDNKPSFIWANTFGTISSLWTFPNTNEDKPSVFEK